MKTPQVIAGNRIQDFKIILAMLYCFYVTIKRRYPPLLVMVLNCEIRVLIYTFFEVKSFGKEESEFELLGFYGGN
jgi:hypothetical protein